MTVQELADWLKGRHLTMRAMFAAGEWHVQIEARDGTNCWGRSGLSLERAIDDAKSRVERT